MALILEFFYGSDAQALGVLRPRIFLHTFQSFLDADAETKKSIKTCKNGFMADLRMTFLFLELFHQRSKPNSLSNLSFIIFKIERK